MRSNDARVINRLTAAAVTRYSRERTNGSTHEQALGDVVWLVLNDADAELDELTVRATAAHRALSGGDPEMEHGESDDVLAWFVPAEVLKARSEAQDRARGWWWA